MATAFCGGVLPYDVAASWLNFALPGAVEADDHDPPAAAAAVVPRVGRGHELAGERGRDRAGTAVLPSRSRQDHRGVALVLGRRRARDLAGIRGRARWSRSCRSGRSARWWPWSSGRGAAVDVVVESPGARARTLLPGPPPAAVVDEVDGRRRGAAEDEEASRRSTDVEDVDEAAVEYGGRMRQHRPEPQLRGLADHAARLVAVLHAREVDDDLVAVALDLGLGHAEAVDPVADDVDGLVEHRARPLSARPARAGPRSRPGGRGRAPGSSRSRA